MANSFWNFVSQFTAGTLAKAEDVNTNFSGVEAGFDAVETETDQAIKVTNAAGVTDVVLNAAARANKLLAFDASGDVIASQILGVWKGAHADAAGTDYQVRDVVRDDAGYSSAACISVTTRIPRPDHCSPIRRTGISWSMPPT